MTIAMAENLGITSTGSFSSKHTIRNAADIQRLFFLYDADQVFVSDSGEVWVEFED